MISRHRPVSCLTALAAAVLAAATLSGCGSDDGGDAGRTGSDGKAGKKSHPFEGRWHSDGSEVGGGGTRLIVKADGSLRFESSVTCTGTSRPAAGTSYLFSIDCGEAKFSGTADAPGDAERFTMKWEEGDSSEFKAEG